jgi:hypothetical protein
VPFTFSHPAAVLPLTFIDKRRLSVTALTIGSVTPDFEYFLTLQPVSFHAHKFLGILWYDLPLSILLFYLFTLLVKDELIDNLPSFLHQRFARFKMGKGIKPLKKSFPVILTSLLIGITSHLLWDKFTHRSASLLEDVFQSYSFIWNVSSIVGALIITYVILKTPKTTPRVAKDYFLFWFVVLSTVMVFVIVRSAREVVFQYLVLAAILGLSVGLLAASLISRAIRSRQPQV